MAFIVGSNTGPTTGNKLKSVLGNPANTTRALVPGVDRLVWADCTLGSITLTLPAVASVAGVEFTIMRVDSSTSNFVTIDSASGDINVSDKFILGNTLERLTVHSDGVAYRILESRTIAGASLGFNNPGSPDVQSVTTTPTVLAALTIPQFSTPGRIVPNASSHQLDVLNVMNPIQDGYTVTFDISFTRQNNVDIHFEIFTDGVASGKGIFSVGNGANVVQASIEVLVGVPFPEPSTIDIRVSQETGTTDLETLISNFTAIRIGG